MTGMRATWLLARWGPIAIGISGVIVLIALWLVIGKPDEFTDSDVVFCLSEQQQPRLVESAETLGLARAGGSPDRVRIGDREIALTEWRSEREPDFRRSCLALSPPRPAGQPTAVQTGLVATANVAIGGLIGYLSARARDRKQRREDEARRLHTASTAFVAAVENYVRDRAAPFRSDPPDAGDVRSRRNELAAELRLVQARYPSWAAPRQALATLDGQLGHALTTRWEEPGVRAAELTAALDLFAAETCSIAVELERGVDPQRQARP